MKVKAISSNVYKSNPPSTCLLFVDTRYSFDRPYFLCLFSLKLPYTLFVIFSKALTILSSLSTTEIVFIFAKEKFKLSTTILASKRSSHRDLPFVSTTECQMISFFSRFAFPQKVYFLKIYLTSYDFPHSFTDCLHI